MLTPTGPTYRVYTPTDLQSISPATFRRGPAPRKGGWFGFSFVLLVGLVLSGASFAALRFLNVDLASGRTSLGASTPEAPAVAPVITSPDVPPSPATTTDGPAPRAETSGASAKVRRKVRGPRRSAPPALNLPRAAVVQNAAVAPHRAAAPHPAVAPDTLPPNPF